MKLQFSKEILDAAPALQVLQVEARVSNEATGDALWDEMMRFTASLREICTIEEVRHAPAIDATRAAYKRCGKDPNRYRPSAEALRRRAVRGLDLYRTLSVIDLINYLSLTTGHSIGGFDADRIEGCTLTLGIGREGEPYEAIGRGELNIAGLPVYRDTVGGVGTPTSDNERTKLSADTRSLLMTVNIYNGATADEISALENETRRLLEHYAAATDITFTLYRPHENP